MPPLDEAWAWWRAVTAAADPYLDSLAGARLTRRWPRESSRETPGTKLHRTTYHYWFHLSESQAVRQMLGHVKLPDFVGGFGESQYRPETSSRDSRGSGNAATASRRPRPAMRGRRLARAIP